MERASSAAAVSSLLVRAARLEDLQRLTDIYNHYVIHTPITFDLEPLSPEQRLPWLEEHTASGPYRLLVAEEGGLVLGYASSSRFRVRPAYDTTIETSIYCAPEATGRGVGTALYTRLFAALRGEDVHMAIAAVTVPNEASVRIHRRFGFLPAGVMHAVGRKFGRYWDVAHFEKTLA